MSHQLNGLFAWAREHRETMAKAIQLMEHGTMSTGEIRQGRPIDTTSETIATYRRHISELDDLLARHEAKNA